MKKYKLLDWSNIGLNELGKMCALENKLPLGIKFPIVANQCTDDQLITSFPMITFLSVPTIYEGMPRLIGLDCFIYEEIKENYNLPTQFPTELFLLVLADDDFYDHTVYSNIGFYLTKEEAETRGNELLNLYCKERVIVQKWIWDGTKFKIELNETDSKL